MLQGLTAQQFTQFQARHEVLPYDHTEKMLGLIAWMLASYLKFDGVDESVCMPWVDTSPAAQMAAATGG